MRYPRNPLCRRLLVAVMLSALIVAATGCGSGKKSSAKARPATAAATVAGTSVRLADVLTDLKAEAAAGKKGKAKTDPSSPLAAPKPGKSGAFAPAATAAALTNRVLYELYDQALRSHKAKVAEADKDRARQALCADATTGKVPSGTSCPPLAAYPAAYRTFQLTLRARELAFGKVLYGRVFDTVKRTKPNLLREVCLNLVQVASQSVSDQVEKSMKAGASLEDASKKAAATGKASTVQPGCLFAAVAPSSLAKAKKGAVVPVKGQGVLGVAEVTSLRTATKSEFATQPPASDASVQKLIKGEVDRSIRRAKVKVPAKYGRWDAGQLVVVPPKGLAKPTTTITGPSTSSTTSTTSGATPTSGSTPTTTTTTTP